MDRQQKCSFCHRIIKKKDQFYQLQCQHISCTKCYAEKKRQATQHEHVKEFQCKICAKPIQTSYKVTIKNSERQKNQKSLSIQSLSKSKYNKVSYNNKKNKKLQQEKFLNQSIAVIHPNQDYIQEKYQQQKRQQNKEQLIDLQNDREDIKMTNEQIKEILSNYNKLQSQNKKISEENKKLNQQLSNYKKIVHQLQIKIQNKQLSHDKIIKEKNMQIQTMYKEVRQAIQQIIKTKSLILKQFKLCAEKRQKISLQYQGLFHYNQDVLELLNNTTMDKLRKFQNNPNQILKQINRQIQDIKLNHQYIRQNFGPTEPHILKKTIQTFQKFDNLFNQLKNSGKQFQNQFFGMIKQEQKQKYQNTNLSYEQIKQLQYQKFFNQAQRFIIKASNQKYVGVEQQLQEIQEKLEHIDLDQLKQLCQNKDLIKTSFINEKKPQPQQSESENEMKQKMKSKYNSQKLNNNKRFFINHNQHQSNQRSNNFFKSSNMFFTPQRQNNKTNQTESSIGQNNLERQWQI